MNKKELKNMLYNIKEIIYNSFDQDEAVYNLEEYFNEMEETLDE